MFPMKKFFILFFILIILAGTVFFFGWMQFAVPAGNYGVMLSKSGGYYSKPIMPGEFMWRWERLVPTNAKILVFNLAPYEIEYQTEGVLPASENFANIMERKTDFSWKYGISISVSVNPANLIDIVKTGSIKLQADLDSYVRGKVEEAAQKSANEYITYFLQNPEEYKKIQFQQGTFQEKIADNIRQKLGAEIIVNSIKLSSNLVIPDLNLYTVMREAYINYEKNKSQMLAELTTIEGRKNAEQKFRMDEMKNWGELLKQYPELIDFLAVARNDASETLKALRELQRKNETKVQE